MKQRRMMGLRKLLILLAFFLFHLEVLDASAVPRERVTLQLQWLDQFQFAGYYMAIEKGFYRDAGLEVALKPFHPGMCVTEEVLSGRADYGIGRSSLLIDRLKGRPVVALAAIFQSSPNVLLAREDSGIRKISDFRGKRIMLTKDAQDSITYQAMLNAEGVSFDDVFRLEHSFDLQDLIDGTTDLMACYSSNEPYRMKERKIPVTVFAPKDYGFDFYNDILFTTEQEVQKHPERVQAFLMATIKGWHYAFEHVEESVDLILQRHNTQNKSRKALLHEAIALKKLAFADGHPLGHIAIEKFRAVYDLYRVMGMAPEAWKHTEGFIYPSPLNAAVTLNEQEQEFLQRHPLTFGSTYYDAPYNVASSSRGFPLNAIAHEMWTKIADKNGIAFHSEYYPTCQEARRAVQKRRADLTFYFNCLEEKPDKVLLSKPYVTFPNVIATAGSVNYIPNLSALNGHRVAVRSGSAITTELAKHHPEILQVPVATANEAVKLLVRGHVYAVIDLLPLISNVINREGYDTIKISGTTNFNQHLHFMIRSDYPELRTIIDKTIDTIPPQERDTILNRYSELPQSATIDYGLIVKIIATALVLIAALFYRQNILKRHNLALLEMANTDKLTRLHNRLKLDRSLEELFEHYRRYHRPFSLILLDIDDFKQINDYYGHLAGDRALRTLSDLLKNHLRATDIPGRWGGEEFLILCPETEAGGAMQLANHLRESISRTSIQGIGTLTCSFGVTAIAEGDSSEKVVKRVDDALYKAKNAGKNRVVLL
jgi:polar amino acid transport system substrate-binding protein